MVTQNKIALAHHADARDEDTDEVLNFAFINSYYLICIKNLLDRAVPTRVDLATELRLNDAFREIDEIPLDSVRRRISVVFAALGNGRDREVLASCTHVHVPDPSWAAVYAA